MNKCTKTILAVMVLAAGLAVSACGPGPEEVVTGYFEASTAKDAEKAAAAMADSEQAAAKEALKARFDADDKVVSFEITSTERNSSEAVVKANVTRTRKGNEKAMEEVYYLSNTSGEWRIDWSMAEFMNRDFEAEAEEMFADDAEASVE